MSRLKGIFIDRDGGGPTTFSYVVVYLVLAHVFYWKLLVPGQMIFGTDIQNQSYPIQHMAVSEMIKDRSLMLWNPYIFSGMPFLASFSFPFFYPVAGLFFVLPLGFAMGYEFVIHTFLMGVFMFAFLSRLKLSKGAAFVGGLLFMFNAHFISLVYPGHGGKLFTMTFLPLALLFLDRALEERPFFNMTMMGLMVGLMFFAGHVQILFYCGIMLLLFLVMRVVTGVRARGYRWALKAAAGFCMAFALGTMLYAVILIPAWEYRGYTHRAGGVTGASSYEFATSFSQPPEDMLYLFLRNPFGWGKDYGPTIPTTDGIFYRGRIGLRLSIDYFSVFGIALALIGFIFRRNRYTWFFAGMAALAGFLALGGFNPFYRYIYGYVPGFSMFRVPYAIMILMPVCGGVLAAFGMQYLLDYGDAAKRRGLGYFIGAGSGLAVAVLAVAVYSSKNSVEVINRLVRFEWVRQMLWGYYGDINERFAFFMSNVYVFAVTLAVSMLILFVYRKGLLKVKYLTLAAVVFILADLWPLGWDFIKTVPVSSINDVYFKDTPQIEVLEKDDEGPFRVFSLVTNNELLFRGIHDLRGYHAVPLGYYEDTLGSIKFVNSVLDMLNAKYLMLPRKPEFDFARAPASDREALDKKFRIVSKDDRVLMYENRDVMPRAWLVNRVWWVADEEQARATIADMRFRPMDFAVLVRPKGTGASVPAASPPIQEGADLSAQGVTVASYSPDRVELDVFAPADSFLVASEVWYPGWKAYVDGSETKVYRADYTLRGLAVPKGEHRVVMEFDPPTFKLGAAISLLTLLFFAGFMGREYRLRRRPAVGKDAR